MHECVFYDQCTLQCNHKLPTERLLSSIDQMLLSRLHIVLLQQFDSLIFFIRMYDNNDEKLLLYVPTMIEKNATIKL